MEKILTSNQIKSKIENYRQKIRRDENGEIIFDKKYDDWMRYCNKKWKRN